MKRRLISGSAWSTAATGFSQLAGMITLVVVARQVGANAFGMVAIVLVTIELSREVVTAGLPDHLIRSKRWDDVLASSALLFQAGVATVLAAAMASSGAIIVATGNQTLGLVFIALAPTYVLDGVASVFTARMQRRFRFRAASLGTLGANVLGGAAAVATALAGWDVWALVLGRVTTAVAGLVIVVALARWRPSAKFSPALWDTLRHSWKLAAANLLGTANLRVTDFIVGVVAGASTLGLYQIASRALDLVLATVVAPGQRIALAGFAALNDPTRMANDLLRLLRVSSIVAFPIFVGLSALSSEFVGIAFGPLWEDAATPMALLTLVGAPALVTYLLNPVLTAVDHTHWLIRFALVMTVLSTVSALAMAGFGIVAIAAGFLARSLLGGLLALSVLERAVGLRPVQALGALAPAATSAAVMFVAVTQLRGLTEGTGLYLQTVLLVAAGAVSYVLALVVLWPRQTRAAYQELAS